MLIVDRSSETGLFRHLSNQLFGVRKFGNIKFLRIVLFFENIQKFKLDFKNEEKSLEKIFCFWDNCNLIGIVNFLY